jgi:hypothetical protein
MKVVRLLGTIVVCFSLASPVAARGAEGQAQSGEGALVFIDVAGAPGDGEKSLARALGERLLAQGLALSSTPEAGAYEIQALVRVSLAAKNKETVRIDWTVFGLNGNQLGTVSQTNDVRKGSLDRSWGRAAEAAAEAAAQDILKLLPPQQ